MDKSEFEKLDRQSKIEYLRNYSRQKKKSGIEYFTVTGDANHRYQPFPLSDTQESFLTGRYMGPKQARVGCHIYCEIKEHHLDLERLNHAWNRLVRVHDMLRNKLYPNGTQQINETSNPYLIQGYYENELGKEQFKALRVQLRDEMECKVYKVNEFPLYEIKTTIDSEGTGIIHFSIDEWIVDAASVAILLKQWYHSYHERSYEIAEPNFSYRDFVMAQKDFENTEKFKADLKYWKEKFECERDLKISFLSDGSNMTSLKKTMKRYEYVLPSENLKRLKSAAERIGVSPTAYLLNLFTLTIRKFNRDDSFSVILTYFNRLPVAKDIDQVIAPFISTSLYLENADENLSVEDRAKRVQEQLFQDNEHNSVSGIRVLRELKKDGKQAANFSIPIVFTSMMNNVESDGQKSGGTWFDQITYTITQTPQVYLDHQIMEKNGCLYMNWDVREQFFTKGIIEEMFENYCSSLLDCTGTPQIKKMDEVEFGTTNLQKSYILRHRNEMKDSENRILYQEFIVTGMTEEHISRNWNGIIEDTKALKLVLTKEGKQYMIPDSKQVEIQAYDFGGLSADESMTEAAKIRERMVGREFPLFGWPRFELCMIRRNSQEIQVNVGFDPSLIDGKSLSILYRRLFEREDSGFRDQTSFCDYLTAREAYEKSDDCEASRNYWANKARRIPDGPFAKLWQRETAHKTTVRITEYLKNWEQIKKECQKRGLETESVLLTAYCDALGSMAEEERFGIVCVSWDRPKWEPPIEHTVGEFAFVSWIEGGNRTGSFWERVTTTDRERRRDAAHINVCGIRQMGRLKKAPRLPVVFTGMVKEEEFRLPGHVRRSTGLSKTPGVYLDQISFEEGRELQINWDYDADVFSEEMIQKLLKIYIRQLENLTDVSEQPGTEEEILTIFSEELNCDQIQLTDDIFDLGATSLSIVNIVQKIEDRTGTELEVDFILEHPTIGSILDQIGTKPDTNPYQIDETGFHHLLSLLRKEVFEGNSCYLYASSGGKYAVQTYLYLKKGAVGNMEEGIYYYNPQEHQLTILSNGRRVNERSFHPYDREVYKESAIVFFFIAQLDAIQPIYQELSRSLVVLDTGYIQSLLEGDYNDSKISVLSVNAFDFERIKDDFKLESGHVFIGAMLAGYHIQTARRESLEHYIERTKISRTQHFISAPKYMTEFAAKEMNASMKYKQLSKKETLKLIKQELHLRKFGPEAKKVSLEKIMFHKERYLNRTSKREYSKDHIAFHEILDFLSQMERKQLIQVYLYVKEGRISGLEEGVYEYNGELKYITNRFQLPIEYCHIPFNRPHFKESAFSIYFIANIKQAKSVYHEEFMNCLLLDAGKIGQKLMEVQSKFHLGIVPIGGMNFERLKEDFLLGTDDMLLHSFMGGKFYYEEEEDVQVSEKGRIAIIGLSGRYPDAPTLEEFWVNLSNGTSCISDLPQERKKLWGAKYDEGFSYPGGYLKGIDQFDYRFFQIAPSEAKHMDPQERLMLQSVEECIESAGYTKESLKETYHNIGVYIGSMWGDYEFYGYQKWEDGKTADLVSLPSAIANRISYHFDFSGPSITIQTACSSSITAFYMAYQGLFNGECDAALVGGVNLISHPYHYDALKSQDILSEEGTNHLFSTGGSGLLCGEGAGALLLTKENAASINGDFVWAYVKGAVISSYGKTSRYGMVSQKKQEELMKKLLTESDTKPDEIQYIEAAASGLSVADTIELNAIANVITQYPVENEYFVGSIKGSIGHLESASFLSQLTKTILQMKHNMLVPTLVGKEFIPSSQQKESGLTLVRALRAWNVKKGKRRAIINSFGASGSIGSVLIEEHQQEDIGEYDYEILCFSAKTKETLIEYLKRISLWMQTGEQVSLRSLAYTLRNGRTDQAVRVAFLSNSWEDLKKLVEECIRGCCPKKVYCAMEHQNSDIEEKIQAAKGWCNENINEEAFHTYFKKAKKTYLPALPFQQSTCWHTVRNQAEEENTSKNTEGLLEYLTGLYAKISEIPREEIELDVPFEEYGLSSLIITEMNQALEKEFNIRKKTLLFEVKTMREFAESVQNEMKARDENPVSNANGNMAVSSDIAIVGLSGKYPGADDLNEFWDILRDGKDCVKEIPAKRWDYKKYYDEDMEGKSYSKWGGFLDDIACFDPAFFHIAPKEAELMDPQERLFLEIAWNAFEDAGYTRDIIREKYDGNVGVYACSMFNDYQLYSGRKRDGTYISSGAIEASISNRVSYFMDLHGPSMTINTMCSSVLTAINLAVQSLTSGECKMALVGGVNLIVHPNKYILHCQNQMLSKTGRCRAFAENADGFVPAEGVGAILLKPLEQAISDQDHIHGVIKGIKINHDGKKNGYFVPNPVQQANLIRSCLEENKISPESISYVEAHGTGTKLGDPIEIEGLSKVFGRANKSACAIGSVKSNIGHCESAAAMASITKVLLQMKYNKIVPSIHTNKLNSNIDFENTSFYVPVKLEEWENTGMPKRATVSSFGAGGGNGFLVLEEYKQDDIEETAIKKEEQIFVLSARNQNSLKTYLENYLKFIEWNKSLLERPLYFNQMIHTLQNRRESFKERIAIVANDIHELSMCIRQLLQDGYGENIFTKEEGNPKCLNRNAEIANQWVLGNRIDWTQYFSEGKQQILPLPTYPFSNEKYWIEETVLFDDRKYEEEARQNIKPNQSDMDQTGLKDTIKKIIMDITKLKTEQFEEGLTLVEYGFDSILLTKLKHSLEHKFQIKLTGMEISFDHTLKDIETLLFARATKTEPEIENKEIEIDLDHRYCIFPLSDTQESFLVGREMDEFETGCHIYYEIEVKDIDPSKLNDAWNELLRHHDMLRAVITPKGKQKVLETVNPYLFETYDAKRMDEKRFLEIRKELRETMECKVYRTSDYPLYEIKVTIDANGNGRIHFSIDEWIVDATSIKILFEQWYKCYNDPGYSLKPLSFTYRDFLMAQKAYENDNTFRNDLDYWKEKIGNGTYSKLQVLNPRYTLTERKKPKQYQYELTQEKWSFIKKMSKDLSVSPTAYLLTVFVDVLKKFNSGQRIPITMTFFNRQPIHEEIEQVVGPFVSTVLYLADEENGHSDFNDRVKQTQADLLLNNDHNRVSGVRLLRELKKEKRIDKSFSIPIVFTSMISNLAETKVQYDSWYQNVTYSVTQTPQVLLDHQIIEKNKKLVFNWEVREEAFQKGIMEELFRSYCCALEERASLIKIVSNNDAGKAFPFSDLQYSYVYADSLSGHSKRESILYQEILVTGMEEEAINQKLVRLIQDTDALRTVLTAKGKQYILPEVEYTGAEIIDFSDLSPSEYREETVKLRKKMEEKEFPLFGWPRFELCIIRKNRQEIQINMSFDPSLMDGRSLAIFYRRLFQTEDAGFRDQTSFQDYLIAKEAFERSDEADASKDYWEHKIKRIKDGPFASLWKEKEEQGSTIRLTEYLKNWEEIKKEARKRDVEVESVLLTAYGDALSSMAEEEDFGIVCVSWDRPKTEPSIEHTIGELAFVSWYEREKQTGSFWERVVRTDLERERDAAHRSVCPIRQMGRQKNAPKLPVVFTGMVKEEALRLPEHVTLVTGLSKTPGVYLDTISFEVGRELQINWDYHSGIFPEKMIVKMFQRYIHNLKELTIEKGRMQGITDKVDESAKRYPDRIAVSCRNTSLTYEELREKSDRLAGYLRAKGVRKNELVGICMDRSIEMVAGILGILKSGGAYVPLDPVYPQERLDFIVEDSALRYVICDEKGKNKRREGVNKEQLISITEDWQDIEGAETGENESGELAYVIYTSGSTGTPKGVLVTHENVTRLFESTECWYDFGPSDVWSMYHSYAFDFSVWEIWGALFYGGRLAVIPYEESRSFKKFYQTLEKEQITVLNQTPTAFKELMRAEEGGVRDLKLRYIIFGGEALQMKDVKPWFSRHQGENTKLINMYGITETTVHVTYREIKEEDIEKDRNSVIGVAIPDLKIYLLNEEKQEVKPGETGELCISGKGVTRGYLNREALTEEKFIENPYQQGEKLYLSGDLGRYNEEGELEYIGRKDRQVKVRGFRIELGEIEAVLESYKGVTASVVSIEEKDGEQLIKAGIVSEEELDGRKIRNYVKERLPVYMIPNIVQKIDQLPMTENGKVDRKKIDQKKADRMNGNGVSYESVKKAVLKIIEEELEETITNENEDIYDLGATSLSIVNISKEIKNQWKLNVPVDVFLDHPIIGEILAYIKKSMVIEPVLEDGKVEISQNQFSRMLSYLKMQKINGNSKYLYASAGGKYSIQTYAYIKENRIEGMNGGLYYYHPEEHVLYPIESHLRMEGRMYPAHYRKAFEESAFALFFIGQRKAIEPVYLDFSDGLMTIDAGYLQEVLRSGQTDFKIHLLNTEGFDFLSVKQHFDLDDGAYYVTSILGGAKEPKLPVSNYDWDTEILTKHQAEKETYLTVAEEEEKLHNMRYNDLSKREIFELVRQKLHIRKFQGTGNVVKLAPIEHEERNYFNRSSKREYSRIKISEKQLLGMFSRLYHDTGERCYFSLGDKYFLNMYLHIREDMVEGRKEGVYRYDWDARALVPVTLEENIPVSRCHTPFNRPHSNKSGFGIYFLADMEAADREYGQGALKNIMLEAGGLGQRLMSVQAEYGVGLVPVGGMNFDRIRRYFKIRDGEILIHSFIGGSFEYHTKAESVHIVPQTTSDKNDDIAIVGMSGRFPQAKDLEALWKNLKSGTNCMTEIPNSRWEKQDYPNLPSYGGFLDEIEQFDASFFQLLKEEADLMDPQVRLFLETVCDALEDAGYQWTKEKREKNIGVFVGAMYEQYSYLNREHRDSDLMAIQSYSSLANRISYYFDFCGPSVSVDSACSSAGTAIKMACDSLKLKESNVAVAGGVNITVHPDKYSALKKMNLISSEKEIQCFGEGEGFLPGEGVGALVLKRLKDAEEAKDPIYGVIKAVKTGHTGRTKSYSLPSTKQEIKLIEETIQASGLSIHDIDYVECAANGTQIGDAAEYSALSTVFQRRKKELPVGSLKSNIGHLESASGIAQIAKVLLQFKHGEIAPNIAAKTINPLIDTENSMLRIEEEGRTDWRTKHGAKAVLIDSFAAGGTNVCLVVQEYLKEKTHLSDPDRDFLILFSARSEKQLAHMLNNMKNWMEANKDAAISDIAYTLMYHKTFYDHRISFTCSSIDEFCAELNRKIAEKSGLQNDRTPKTYPQILRIFEETEEGKNIVQTWIDEKKWNMLSELWESGIDIDWRAIPYFQTGSKINLPSYPFHKERCWLDSYEIVDPQIQPVVDDSRESMKQYLYESLKLHADVAEEEDLHNIGFNSMFAIKLRMDLKKKFHCDIALNELVVCNQIGEIIDKMHQKITNGSGGILNV